MAKQTVSGETRPSSSPFDYIGRLFEEDNWFLRKVLTYLIDDGLHECRRVCREWNNACNTLPVKLQQVPREHLSKVLATFPNAVEVSCAGAFSSDDLGIARKLAGMSSLKHLDRLRYATDQMSAGVEVHHTETYTRLQSLAVSLQTASFENFRNAFPYLTGLRKLDVNGMDIPYGDLPSWTPFEELNELRELTLFGGSLKNGSNQIMFPAPALTKLTVNVEVFTNMSVPELLSVRCHLTPVSSSLLTLSFQTVGHYAGTLRSLNLSNVRARSVEPSRMWTGLKCFDQLEVLEMHIIVVEPEESLDSLFSVVAAIDTLRSLALSMHSYPRHSIGDVFCFLTKLQSLSLVVYTSFLRARRVSVCVSQLTRLTSLKLGGVSIRGSFLPLSKLKYLSMNKLPRSWEDPSNALVQLTNLTELQWNDEGRSILSNHILSQLKSLRRLSLSARDDLDPEAFQSLASLTNLTTFAYCSSSKQASLDSFRKQFTVLTQLQELTLECGGTTSQEFDVLGLFGEGTFPRLRQLVLWHPKQKRGDEQMLFNRFPCLKSYMPNEPRIRIARV